MGASWSDLFPDLGPPIGGRPDDYRDVATRAADLSEGAEAFRAGFAEVGGLDLVRGRTGPAVAAMVHEVSAALDDLPAVAASLHAVLTDHAARLDALCTDAAVTLARASARAIAEEQARAASTAAAAALVAIEQQLRWAHASAPTELDGAVRVDALELRRWVARTHAADREHDLIAAVAAVATSRREHELLTADEQALRARTCATLDGLDLGDLRDPSGWRAVVGTLGSVLGGVWHFTGGAFVDLAGSVAAAATAALDGRLFDALHHLGDAIDAATRIVTAVAVVAIVLGSTVMPGALLLLPAVLAASGAISAADVAVTAALAWSQAAHPDTGERVGVADLLGSAVAAAAGRLGAGRALAGSRAVEVGALRAAGVRAGHRTFLRTAGQNAEVLASAAHGGSVVNPATGRLVAGAARDQMVRRATVEAAAHQTRTRTATTITEVIVPDLAERAAEPVIAGGLAAAHPDAEAALDHAVFEVVLGHIEPQLEHLARLGAAPA